MTVTRTDHITRTDHKWKLIVALDVSTLAEALSLVEQLHPFVGYFKVGLELLTAEGAPRVVKAIHDEGGKVFYDGKFSDIPNTIEKASRVVAHDLEVGIFNIHANCGFESMKRAADVAHSSPVGSIVLAVTVLTSLDVNEVSRMYQTFQLAVDSTSEEIKDLVIEGMAIKAKEAGVDGLICSPQDLPALQKLDLGLRYVTPGVRPEWAAKGDQKRVTTPAQAIRNGADMLVVGRPITQPPEHIGSPVKAAQEILKEIESALE